jgi:hypothetical protein
VPFGIIAAFTFAAALFGVQDDVACVADEKLSLQFTGDIKVLKSDKVIFFVSNALLSQTGTKSADKSAPPDVSCTKPNMVKLAIYFQINLSLFDALTSNLLLFGALQSK